MRIITTVLIVFFGIAGYYSIINPLFESPDELYHYPMVKTIADGNGLPVLDENTRSQPYRQEGGQPPLYYMLGALLTAPIDTSDMSGVRVINPHADVGLVKPDGNVNVTVHPPTTTFPWQGTRLAVHLMRFFSITLACGTIFYTYQLGKLLSGNSTIALIAAFMVAFNPMFVYISASVNNDNLSTLIATFLLFRVNQLLIQPQKPTIRHYVILGIAAGGGLLAKFQIGFFLPIIAFTLIIRSWCDRSIWIVVFGGAISGTLTIAISGWWYLRNWQLYDDPTGIDAFLEVVGRDPASSVSALVRNEYESFLRTFWGMFGWVNVPMAEWIYVAFYAIAAIGLIGLVFSLQPSTLKRLDGRQIARWITAVWLVVVLAALIRWSMLTTASQGRLLYAAIAPLMIGIGAGWVRISDLLKLKSGLLAVPLIWLALVTVTFAPLTIIEAYQIPSRILFQDDQATFAFAAPDSDQPLIVGRIHRVDEVVQPDDAVDIVLDLKLVEPTNTNWSMFIHLVSEFGVIEAQRDVLPGGGTIGTKWLDRGYAWQNKIAIPIPPTIYSPQSLQIVLGFYDYQTGQRLVVFDSAETSVALGMLLLTNPIDDIPNPVDINFGDQLLLQGYDVSARTIERGETLEITLHWEALTDIDEDYVVSVQLIDPETFQKAGQSDNIPVTNTSTWAAGHAETDVRTIMIDENAPRGNYRVLVSVYQVKDGTVENLPILVFRQSRPANTAYLSWLRVEE